MNNPINRAADQICDAAEIETASFETLAAGLIALCAQAVAQDRARRELVARLRKGAEDARALETKIQQTEKQRA